MVVICWATSHVRGFAESDTLSLRVKEVWGERASFTSLHFTSHHFTSLHVTSLHFTSLHFTSLHFTSLHVTSLHFTSLHFTSLHVTSLHFSSLHITSHVELCCGDGHRARLLRRPDIHSGHIVVSSFVCALSELRLICVTASLAQVKQLSEFHFTSLHFTSLHFTSLHFTSLHFTSLHFTSLHFTSLHFTSLLITSHHMLSCAAETGTADDS